MDKFSEQWNLLSYQGVSSWETLLSHKKHKPQLEYTNEYLLHHRSSGRGSSCCGVLRIACLTEQHGTDLILRAVERVKLRGGPPGTSIVRSWPMLLQKSAASRQHEKIES